MGPAQGKVTQSSWLWKYWSSTDNQKCVDSPCTRPTVSFALRAKLTDALWKHTYDLTSYFPAWVCALKPLYGALGMFFTSSLSIWRPDRATPIILNFTWNVGSVCNWASPSSRRKFPESTGALSFGICPIVQRQVCVKKSSVRQALQGTSRALKEKDAISKI